MMFRVYTLYDPLAEESGPLWQSKNDAVAERQARDLIASMSLSYETFQLWCVGLYDPEKMAMTPASDRVYWSELIAPKVVANE